MLKTHSLVPTNPVFSDPLKPSAGLLCKLASIIVHSDEMVSSDGHYFDKVALDQLRADPEIIDWLKTMSDNGMAPKMRRK